MSIAQRFFTMVTKDAANLIELVYIYQIIQKANIEQGSVFRLRSITMTNSVRFVAITFYQPIISVALDFGGIMS